MNCETHRNKLSRLKAYEEWIKLESRDGIYQWHLRHTPWFDSQILGIIADREYIEMKEKKQKSKEVSFIDDNLMKPFPEELKVQNKNISINSQIEKSDCVFTQSDSSDNNN